MQTATLSEFEHEDERVGRIVHRQDSHDMRVVDARLQRGLAMQPLPVSGFSSPQHLERDASTGVLLGRHPDAGVTPHAEQPFDGIPR